MVGLTGFEPVTLRLSSACSNQLSYRPVVAGISPLGGAEEIRTPDLLRAKQTLYQLSYSPVIVIVLSQIRFRNPNQLRIKRTAFESQIVR